jgi:hypothetical protein
VIRRALDINPDINPDIISDINPDINPDTISDINLDVIQDIIQNDDTQRPADDQLMSLSISNEPEKSFPGGAFSF